MYNQTMTSVLHLHPQYYNVATSTCNQNTGRTCFLHMQPKHLHPLGCTDFPKHNRQLIVQDAIQSETENVAHHRDLRRSWIERKTSSHPPSPLTSPSSVVVKRKYQDAEEDQ
jgi:hypothetical protein